jgi:D-alanine transaminase
MAEPLPICHLEGQLLPLREARISPLDRSFLFGDGVYEVIPARRGKPRRLAANLARLTRSLAELSIVNPHTGEQWSALIHELIAANGGGDVYVYLQVSRGAEFARNHAPLPKVAPLVFAFCAPLVLPDAELLANGVSCITAEDIRWARCDIKSVALLANVLLRQQAIDAGAGESILLRDGQLTEASASSVCVVIDGEIRCPPQSSRLLPGTTRGLISELAAAHGIACRITPVSERELRAAEEIWLTAATRGAVPVTRLDGAPVGDGRPGALWRRVHALLEAYWLGTSAS